MCSSTSDTASALPNVTTRRARGPPAQASHSLQTNNNPLRAPRRRPIVHCPQGRARLSFQNHAERSDGAIHATCSLPRQNILFLPSPSAARNKYASRAKGWRGAVQCGMVGTVVHQGVGMEYCKVSPDSGCTRISPCYHQNRS